MVLEGHEVKAIRASKVSIKGAYVKILNGQAYLVGSTVSPYQVGNTPEGYDQQRNRKLLLTQKELSYLTEVSQEQGKTLVPIKLFDAHGLIKLEIGIARGKKQADKREAISKREVERKLQRNLKS